MDLATFNLTDVASLLFPAGTAVVLLDLPVSCMLTMSLTGASELTSAMLDAMKLALRSSLPLAVNTTANISLTVADRVADVYNVAIIVNNLGSNVSDSAAVTAALSSSRVLENMGSAAAAAASARRLLAAVSNVTGTTPTTTAVVQSTVTLSYVWCEYSTGSLFYKNQCIFLREFYNGTAGLQWSNGGWPRFARGEYFGINNMRDYDTNPCHYAGLTCKGPNRELACITDMYVRRLPLRQCLPDSAPICAPLLGIFHGAASEAPFRILYRLFI